MMAEPDAAQTRYDDFPDLLFDRPAPHVLRVTINRPAKRNTVTLALHHQLVRVWAAIDADPDVFVSIITGAGSAFCGGGAMEDTQTTQAVPADPEQRFCEDFGAARELVAALIGSRKPIISAINGPAVGAGLAIALLADISIAAKTAKLFDGHLRIGVVPGDHAALIWPLLCGLAKAKFYLMTNRAMTGEEAERCNLVAMAVDADDLSSTAVDVAVSLTHVAPTALSMTKYVMNHWLRQNQTIFDLSAAFEMVNFTGVNARESMRAMAARETPSFAGSTKFI